MTFLGKNRNATIDTLWNRPFAFLNLCCFLIFTNLGLLYLYPLALDAMGSDKHATGWIMGIFSIAAVLSRPFLGKLAIRKGEYWVISLGLLLSFVASLSYNLITAFSPLLLFVRVVHGVGFSAFIA
ncbi:MAG: MFS transporter, partial [Deltaproteobacteria bacterium]|nr:MFS transporter [Deltaproteobacteria bacterium]